MLFVFFIFDTMSLTGLYNTKSSRSNVTANSSNNILCAVLTITGLILLSLLCIVIALSTIQPYYLLVSVSSINFYLSIIVYSQTLLYSNFSMVYSSRTKSDNRNFQRLIYYEKVFFLQIHVMKDSSIEKNAFSNIDILYNTLYAIILCNNIFNVVNRIKIYRCYQWWITYLFRAIYNVKEPHSLY